MLEAHILSLRLSVVRRLAVITRLGVVAWGNTRGEGVGLVVIISWSLVLVGSWGKLVLSGRVVIFVGGGDNALLLKLLLLLLLQLHLLLLGLAVIFIGVLLLLLASITLIRP